MSLCKLEIALSAERDIADAFDWYQRRNTLAADTFRAEVFDAIERVAETPLGKAADAEGNRHRVVRRFPYSVIYEVSGSTITVLAVAHHRRKPSYWQSDKP